MLTSTSLFTKPLGGNKGFVWVESTSVVLSSMAVGNGGSCVMAMASCIACMDCDGIAVVFPVLGTLSDQCGSGLPHAPALWGVLCCVCWHPHAPAALVAQVYISTIFHCSTQRSSTAVHNAPQRCMAHCVQFGQLDVARSVPAVLCAMIAIIARVSLLLGNCASSVWRFLATVQLAVAMLCTASRGGRVFVLVWDDRSLYPEWMAMIDACRHLPRSVL